jgi:hypothetical protein
VKVAIAGEEFEFDPVRRTMADALAIEKIGGKRYVEWENDLFAGSAEAACVLICFLWRREGRTVELADILAGKFGDLDFSETYVSTLRGYGQHVADAQAAAADPTAGAASPAAPDGTPGTPAGTRRSSRKSST